MAFIKPHLLEFFSDKVPKVSLKNLEIFNNFSEKFQSLIDSPATYLDYNSTQI
jgi:hypothetical protein